MKRSHVAKLGYVVFAVLSALVFIPPAVDAETSSALPGNRGFATIKDILGTSCSACHDWTGSYETIVDSGRIVAGNPDASRLYQKIANDEMPAEGEKLTADQKAFVRGWIAAGAPTTELPLAVPAAEASATAGPAAPQGFLFFPSKVAFHEFTGFTSTALFLAAGVVGGIHLLNMMTSAHGSTAIPTDSPATADVTGSDVIDIWTADQVLRWVHVGLLAAGETLYLGDAITGISMFTDQTPGKLTRHDIHRYAFYTHAGLMVTQVILGFLSTDALSRGDHAGQHGLLVAHTAVGFAIPLVMLGAGLENLFLPE
jgi:hypothetical protein